MDVWMASEVAYRNGYEDGKRAIFDEIEDILGRCARARDNGEMITRALRDLMNRYNSQSCTEK